MKIVGQMKVLDVVHLKKEGGQTVILVNPRNAAAGKGGLTGIEKGMKGCLTRNNTTWPIVDTEKVRIGCFGGHLEEEKWGLLLPANVGVIEEGMTVKIELGTDLPEPLAKPDFENLKDLLGDILTSMADGSYHDDNDNDHWVYEAAFEAVYGPTIWEWINEKC